MAKGYEVMECVTLKASTSAERYEVTHLAGGHVCAMRAGVFAEYKPHIMRDPLTA